MIIPVLTIFAVTAVFAPRGDADTISREGLTFAAGQLERDLDAPAKPLETRVIASFESSDGAPCRAFVTPRLSGIACRRDGGWHLRVIRDGISIDDPAGAEGVERGLRGSVAAMRAQ